MAGGARLRNEPAFRGWGLSHAYAVTYGLIIQAPQQQPERQHDHKD
jgi:hypothetical protein